MRPYNQFLFFDDRVSACKGLIVKKVDLKKTFICFLYLWFVSFSFLQSKEQSLWIPHFITDLSEKREEFFEEEQSQEKPKEADLEKIQARPFKDESTDAQIAQRMLGEIRKNSVPLENFNSDSQYLEGYLQALLDMHYYEFNLSVQVKGNKVYLKNLPKNTLLAESILQFIRDFPLVESVELAKNQEEDTLFTKSQRQPLRRLNGVWMPESAVLFSPLIADPRKVDYGLGLRFHDDAISRRSVAVTFGDELPLFRWKNVGKWKGDAQFSIVAGVRTVFDIVPDEGFYQRKGDWAELVNADYLLSFPVTYALDNWAFRVRLYHVSSHLGDEFYQAKIRQEPSFSRRNPSSETIDFFTSYQLDNTLRVYGGYGYSLHKDPSFNFGPGGLEYGVEIKVLGSKDTYNQLYRQPFLAMHFHHLSNKNGRINSHFLIGHEWSKLQGVGRKIRAYLQYRDGYSLEGEFSEKKSSYLSLNLAYGF